MRSEELVTRPQVQIGDRLELPPRSRDGSVRTAVVIASLSPDGSPPYVVSWEDGSRTILYPSAAARVLRAEPDQDESASM